MIFLKSLTYQKPEGKSAQDYPYSIPLFTSLSVLDFKSPVTILAGDNGTGKSSLLECLAICAGSVRIAAVPMEEDVEFQMLNESSRCFKLGWNCKTKKGFFLRAEDFITYTQHLYRTKREVIEDIQRIDRDYQDRLDYSRSLAKMPFRRSLCEMDSLYEGSLNEKSHGESFLDFFRSRIKPAGLYLLDEPETPLSPLSQIAFMMILKEMLEQDCQFVIATHSPIIMAFPGADIYEISHGQISRKDYAQIESVKLLKEFLNNPDCYLRHI